MDPQDAYDRYTAQQEQWMSAEEIGAALDEWWKDYNDHTKEDNRLYYREAVIESALLYIHELVVYDGWGSKFEDDCLDDGVDYVPYADEFNWAPHLVQPFRPFIHNVYEYVMRIKEELGGPVCEIKVMIVWRGK